MKELTRAIIITSCLLVYGCHKVSVPKPRGYFRIDLPEKEYAATDTVKLLRNLPVSFEYPAYGRISEAEDRDEPGWFNIEFPSYKAKIYFTYKTVKDSLSELLEQTYKLNVRNHISKADAINELVISDSKKKVYGILYDLKGNTASAVQFYVTDSTKHYLRGSLYFEAEPNADSLAPVIGFFREDIVHLIGTLRWKM